MQRLMPREFAERLLAARGHVQGERRRVTILFSDVTGSTSIAEGLDPEDVMEIMGGAFDFLIEPVYRYEGTLARLMGDAVLAFFGAPITHEDDPERACRAALEIVKGARHYAARMEQERGIEGFNVRVGINTGLVVVGQVGSDLRVEYTAMGDAVNLAARMEAAAEPGTILIAQDTHKLIAPRFETESLGRIAVRGKAEPVPVYRLLRARPAPARLWGVAGLDSPVVGRQAEFDALEATIERLEAGVGGIVTIVGEAGIGKSRMVAELRKQVPAAFHWVEGRCLSYGASIAYGLWLDVLRSSLNVTPEDSPDRVRDALRERVQALWPESPDQTSAYLERLMSLPLTPQAEAMLEGLEGGELKANTFTVLETLVERSARERPLVLVCEDLHWADPTSMELLESLLALSDRAALLLICVFRADPAHTSWRIRETAARLYRHRHTDLWLDPLSPGDCGTLVANLLGLEGSDHDAGPSNLEPLMWRILDQAEGNPFYVEEIIRSLVDHSVIVHDENTERWRATREVDDIPIPDSVQGVLMARIDRLPEDVRRILQMAAVVGRIFLYRLLAAIAEEERGLDESLITLQREEMIRERTRFPEPEYIFKHELTREAAYGGLLRKERQTLHRKVAVALEQLFADRIEEQVELLARHWTCAGEAETAIDYLVQAGDRARRLGASRQAVDHYQLALQTAAQSELADADAGLPHVHERLGDVYLEHLSLHPEAMHHYDAFLNLSPTGEAAARAGRKMATLYLLRGDLPKAQEYYEAALARLAQLPPLAETCRVHNGLSHLFLARNQLALAERHADASLKIARQIGDKRGLADVHRVRSNIAISRGDLETACAHDEHSLALYRELGNLPRIIQCCNNVGDSYRLLGRMEQALERLDEGLELARQIGDTGGEALILRAKGELFVDQGRWETAAVTLEQALSMAEASGVASVIIESHRVLGCVYERIGRLAGARHHLERAEALMREAQQFRFEPAIHLGLAYLRTAEGDCAEAERHLQLALEAAGSVPSDVLLGQVHHCYGSLYIRCGRWEDAVSHLKRSRTVFRQGGLPAGLGRARLNLGIAYANRREAGDKEHACEELLAALSLFQQLGAEGYLSRADMWVQRMDCRR